MLFCVWFRVLASLSDRDVRSIRCTCSYMDFVVSEYYRCYGFAEVGLGELTSESGVDFVVKKIRECYGHIKHVTGSAVWVGGVIGISAVRRADLAIEVMEALHSAVQIGFVQFGPLVGSLCVSGLERGAWKKYLMSGISVVTERVADVRFGDVELFVMCWWGRLKKAHLHVDLTCKIGGQKEVYCDRNEQLGEYVEHVVGAAVSLQVLRLTLRDYSDDDFGRLVVPECFGAACKINLKRGYCRVTFVVPEYFDKLDDNAKRRFQRRND